MMLLLFLGAIILFFILPIAFKGLGSIVLGVIQFVFVIGAVLVLALFVELVLR